MSVRLLLWCSEALSHIRKTQKNPNKVSTIIIEIIIIYWSFPSSSFLCFFPPHSSHILFHSSLWCLYAFHICIENILHSSLPPHLALNVFRGAHFPVPGFASALSAHRQLGESRGHTCSSDSAHYRVAQEQNTFHFFCLSPTQRM